jgi:hypothetical protein
MTKHWAALLYTALLNLIDMIVALSKALTVI